MTREIKFRIWDLCNQIMYFPSLGELGGFNPEQQQLMQFTGLKDKNGKEIYEGDILQDNINRKKRYTVEYRDYCFCIKEIPNSVWLGATHEFMAIIGNIYSNPGLLK